MNREQTRGERLVRTSFNPSAESSVDAIKANAAHLIDLIDTVVPHGERSERAQAAAIAVTEIRKGAMFAVWAATADLPDFADGVSAPAARKGHSVTHPTIAKEQRLVVCLHDLLLIGGDRLAEDTLKTSSCSALKVLGGVRRTDAATRLHGRFVAALVVSSLLEEHAEVIIRVHRRRPMHRPVLRRRGRRAGPRALACGPPPGRHRLVNRVERNVFSVRRVRLEPGRDRGGRGLLAHNLARDEGRGGLRPQRRIRRDRHVSGEGGSGSARHRPAQDNRPGGVARRVPGGKHSTWRVYRRRFRGRAMIRRSKRPLSASALSKRNPDRLTVREHRRPSTGTASMDGRALLAPILAAIAGRPAAIAARCFG